MCVVSGVRNGNVSVLARTALGTLACAGLVALSSPALAQEGDDGNNTAVSSRRGVPVWTGYHLKSTPGWSIGLETYAGLGVLVDQDVSRGHALAGGLSRFQLSYLEAGGVLEVSDLSVVRWRKVGGFVGAYLPLVNWVDIHATVGLAQRAYSNPDDRYGAGGLALKTSTLTFRLGFSDRVIDERFGLRIGAALLVDADLKRQAAHWSYSQLGVQESVTGNTNVGGFSTGIVVTLGFDVAFRR
jgi:hypothetical protein